MNFEFKSIVAERISYVCLAHNLIWPLGSTHIFTQSGWLILFSPNHFPGQHQIGEKPLNTLFLRSFRTGQTYLLFALFISSRITTQWGKPSNLWTSWVYSLRPRVPSWIWIRWIQSASHRNNFKSPPKLAMSTALQKFRSDIQLLHPWATFSGDMLIFPNNQDHTFMDDDNVPALNQQTRLLLHLWWHISLTHPTMPEPSDEHFTQANNS